MTHHDVSDDARARLATAVTGTSGVDELLARFDRWEPDLVDGLAAVYQIDAVLPRVLDIIAAGHRDRPETLRHRDRDRILRPDWFQRPDALGYVTYVDRFAGDLPGFRSRVPYLVDLGVTYLHLMPLLKPRAGPNDGGYAVADYRAVRADLGDMSDLADLATELHAAGIALTLDLVLNHVAAEHDWARAARAGDARYRGYFHIFGDRTEPDVYERTLPEVFPAFAPGNFSWDEALDGWVWTTFNSWQWDLDWSNPDVFCEFAELVLFLANVGIDCLRLDAIAFLWKRVGTTCQNEPEVHAITQALRAVAHMAAPSLIFKAEAIVGPQDLVTYLGRGERAGRVSDLAYHNSLMVQIWSALAARDGRLLATALGRFPEIPTTTAWATYLRCHDDIGWAIDDEDAAAVGWDGAAHRRFLSDFYSGAFPGSFARGVVFQPNEVTGDARISGSAASLAGIEAARESGDPELLDLAVARLTCAYAMVFGYGGLPLLYMGDELGLTNDYGYLDELAHADDNRWLHRPVMPWSTIGSADSGDTVTAEMVAAIRRLGAARATLGGLHASVATVVAVPEDPAVVLFVRDHAAGNIVQVYNLCEHPRSLALNQVTRHGIASPWDHLADSDVTVIDGRIPLAPYAALWLRERADDLSADYDLTRS